MFRVCITLCLFTAPGGVDRGVGPDPVRIEHTGEGRSWEVAGGTLTAAPGTRWVRFDPGYAGGYVGLIAGELRVQGAAVTVVLPHGVVGGPEPGAYRVRARRDGVVVVDAIDQPVAFQGDGGGAGRAARGGWIAAGPGGAYRSASGPPPTLEAETGTIAVESVARMVRALTGWRQKRSFKLRALERKQLALRSEPAVEAPSVVSGRLSRLRARDAVARAWAQMITQSLQALEGDLEPEMRAGLKSLSKPVLAEEW